MDASSPICDEAAALRYPNIAQINIDEALAAGLFSGTCLSPCLILYYSSPKFRPIRAILFAYVPIAGRGYT
jgi:hypothetical protein